MLVIQCDNDLRRNPSQDELFKTEERSVVFTESLHCENASSSVDAKMVNRNISPEWLDLGNIYVDFLCMLSLSIREDYFFEPQPSLSILLRAFTH